MRKIVGPVRFGIVGTGKIAKKHAVALRALGDEVVLAGVTDVNRQRAEAFAREYGFARVYDNVDQMLCDHPQSPALDALAICTPPKPMAN